MVMLGCWPGGSMRWCGVSLLIGVLVPALAGVWMMVHPGPMMFWQVPWRWPRCLSYTLLLALSLDVQMELRSLLLTWLEFRVPP